MKAATILFATMALTISGPSFADGDGHKHGHADSAAHMNSDMMVDGEIKRINKAGKKLTIKHGPIKSMDMPGMTMVFGVDDPAMLEGLGKGDRIKFSVREAGGQMMIEQLQKQ